MESLKPILLLMVLGGVGYAVYVALNQAPPQEPASNVAQEWNKPANLNTGVLNSPDGTSPQDKPLPATNSRDAAAARYGNPPSGGGVGSSLPFGVGSGSISPPGSNAPGQTDLHSSATTNTRSDEGGVHLANGHAQFGQTNTLPDNRALHEFEATMRAAQSLLQQGQLAESLRELSRWYDHPAVPAQDQPQLIELLGQLSGTVIYSREHRLAPPYVVRAGDSLESIAQQYQVPWQLLAKINGIDHPNALLPGEELKVVRGPFHAQLNRQQNWLALFADGLYAGRFRIEGGQDVVKPDGTYPVAKFPADHPTNTARRRYLSVGGDVALEEQSAGVAPGPRTLSLSPQDMDDVFDILSERSQVTIRR